MKRGFCSSCYSGLARLGFLLGHLFLIVIRLYWGANLFLIGISKFTQLSQVSDHFKALDLPFPLYTALFVGFIEVLGGISLVLGLFSRFMSLLIMILLWTAYATAHHAALVNIFHNPADFFAQSPFLYLFVATIVFCFGPGWISFDYWRERRYIKSTP